MKVWTCVPPLHTKVLVKPVLIGSNVYAGDHPHSHTCHMYEKVIYHRKSGRLLFLVIVSLGKSCPTISTWKPDAQFILTINYMLVWM